MGRTSPFVLAAPSADNTVILWQGNRLTVFTLSPADLVASKLIRYDPTDQADIQFLVIQSRARFEDLVAAASRLPQPFRDDAIVREKLENLRLDLRRWAL